MVFSECIEEKLLEKEWKEMGLESLYKAICQFDVESSCWLNKTGTKKMAFFISQLMMLIMVLLSHSMKRCFIEKVSWFVF